MAKNVYKVATSIVVKDRRTVQRGFSKTNKEASCQYIKFLNIWSNVGDTFRGIMILIFFTWFIDHFNFKKIKVVYYSKIECISNFIRIWWSYNIATSFKELKIKQVYKFNVRRQRSNTRLYLKADAHDESKFCLKVGISWPD